MKNIRFIFAFCALTLAFASLAMVLMNREGTGDAPEADATAETAALEAYFTQMSAINKRSDKQFKKTVFIHQESARSYGEAFDSVLAMLEAEYGKVTPPRDLAVEHETLMEAIKDYRVGIEHGLRPLDADAPPEDFDALFKDVLSDEDLRVTSAFCAIEDAASQEGIKADIGCQRA
jgi:hypothetical protein